MIGSFVGALVLAAPAPAVKLSWSQRFPVVAARVKQLDRRLSCPDRDVRLRVLTELTYFRQRDSRVYPPPNRAAWRRPSTLKLITDWIIKRTGRERR